MGRKTLIAMGILSAVFVSATARADTVFSNNTTNEGIGFIFNGATQSGSNLIASMDLDELNLAAGAGGEAISAMSIKAFNFNGDAVEVRATIAAWAANGTGGGPGTLLGEWALAPLTLASQVETPLSAPISDLSAIIPSNGEIWAGIVFDNGNGASPITAAELNNIGSFVYGPPTIGSTLGSPLFIPGGNAIDVSNPSTASFDYGVSGSSYSWNVEATATPLPKSAMGGAALLAIVTLSELRRRRPAAI